MRWRGANVRSSTCPARMAVSSSSNRAKSGTCLRTSGLHAIDHLMHEKGLAIPSIVGEGPEARIPNITKHVARKVPLREGRLPARKRSRVIVYKSCHSSLVDPGGERRTREFARP